MTAHTMRGDRERCIKAGMDDYIAKPMKPKELYKMIMKHFRFSTRVSSELSSPVDLTQALESVDGDRLLLKDLVDAFIEECPDRLIQLQGVIKKRDYDQIEKWAHSLKGTVGNFGATKAYKLAQTLEIMGRKEEITGAMDVLKQLERELFELKQYFFGNRWMETNG